MQLTFFFHFFYPLSISPCTLIITLKLSSSLSSLKLSSLSSPSPRRRRPTPSQPSPRHRRPMPSQPTPSPTHAIPAQPTPSPTHAIPAQPTPSPTHVVADPRHPSPRRRCLSSSHLSHLPAHAAQSSPLRRSMPPPSPPIRPTPSLYSLCCD